MTTLKRYNVYPDGENEVVPDGQWCYADDATREIERLEGENKELFTAVWRVALEKVAQDFYDSFGHSGSEINIIEVQAFLDSRIVHYPEARTG